MAMVTVRKGNKVVTVSKNAFEHLFKKHGYRPVTARKEKNIKEEHNKTEQNENQEVDIDTIPISEMTKEQLKEYAKKHNIDTTGAQNATQARKMIQKAVREGNL